ncbi:hypothetical protein HZH68_010613 [Vespula germanica]|uniref:Uncharacterized protein n=1 Tax=Vespula germanica TaxID=30212 RepID=A0A834JVM3_VESGE|nr:hypothetical protein HZH68_010613 [Vespula germanica]
MFRCAIAIAAASKVDRSERVEKFRGNGEDFERGSANCLELFSKYEVISMLNELPYMYNVLHCRNVVTGKEQTTSLEYYRIPKIWKIRDHPYRLKFYRTVAIKASLLTVGYLYTVLFLVPMYLCLIRFVLPNYMLYECPGDFDHQRRVMSSLDADNTIIT